MKGIFVNIKIGMIHLIMGAVIFYFLVHPFTMVLYWFEFSDTPFSSSLFMDNFQKRFLDSFGFEMRSMSSLLTALGAVLGLLFSFFWISFNKKKDLIIKQEHLMKRDVQKLIELGESDLLEFKSSLRFDYFKKASNKELELVIAKTIAGFMNAQGGKLIIGVDDHGNILGIENDLNTLKHKNRDGYEREIFRIISVYLDREACFGNHVFFYQIDGKEICLVDIDPSSNPVYVNHEKKTTFYVRTGNATYPLTVKETVKYLNLQKK